MPTWTIFHPDRIFWTGITSSFVTFAFTIMLITIQLLSTYILTSILFRTACCNPFIPTTKAINFYFFLTRNARPFMTLKLTFMFQTIKFFATLVFARKFRSRQNLTRYSLFIFATETFNRNFDATRRAASRMAENFTARMFTSIMLLIVTILSTRVRQLHRLKFRLFKSTTETSISGKLIFCIIIVTIRASPCIKCN